MLDDAHHLEQTNYTVNHLSLAALTNGQQSKPLLLCLHGWLDNAASFQPVIPYLSNYHVVALDWPGHGQSSHRSIDAHYHFFDYVDDLYQLFQMNSWHDVHLVGHSMGGMIASAFTAAFPESVRSLTLIDSIGFITESASQTTAQLRDGIISRHQSQSKQKPNHIELNAAIAARVAVSDLSFEHAKLIVERGIVATEQGFTWRSDSRLRTKSLYRLTEPQAMQLVQDISTPVQLIYGRQGMTLVQTGIARFQGYFTDITCHCLDGGHHVHMEQAQQTAQLIDAFIQGK